MRAVVYTRYGPPEVLRLEEVPSPAPADDEVLVKVRATTVTIGDCRMRSLTVPAAQWLFARLYLGVLRPRRPVLGMELAGDVEAAGKDVTRFKPGDAVTVSTFDVGFGGYAEYKCMPQDGVLVRKPPNLSYEEAAALPGGGMTALRCLGKAKIKPGQTVLVYGASGAVGTNAVQLAARHFGARVAGVCSAANLELVRSLGARRVLDYAAEDFTESGETYDVVFDAVGKLSSAQAKRARKLAGTYLDVHAESSGGHSTDNLQFLAELAEAGVLKPVIDRTYPLEQIVEAHRYVDGGHKKGNVAVTVDPGDGP